MSGVVAGGIIQATAQNLGQFMAGRFVMGTFSCIGAVGGLSLCAELSQ